MIGYHLTMLKVSCTLERWPFGQHFGRPKFESRLVVLSQFPLPLCFLSSYQLYYLKIGKNSTNKSLKVRCKFTKDCFWRLSGCQKVELFSTLCKYLAKNMVSSQWAVGPHSKTFDKTHRNIQIPIGTAAVPKRAVVMCR